MKNILLKFLSVIILVLFSGCGSGKEMIQVQFECDQNTNNGNAVVVTIYQLTNADKFRFSSFESLTKNPDATLGSDLIANSTFERTMVPGEIFKLDKLEIKKETTFLGIIADFHSPAADGWQQLVDVGKGPDQLIISVHENSISVQVDD
ncbi:MAG: type VI secretion system lipoprotein TssJ [Ignavibacteriota bacterium]